LYVRNRSKFLFCVVDPICVHSYARKTVHGRSRFAEAEVDDVKGYWYASLLGYTGDGTMITVCVSVFYGKT